MKCENCGIEHDGKYGSGRFCSVKCARGFSSKYAAKGGSVVVVNVKTGEILALVSYPTYSPEAFYNGISQTKRTHISG